MGASKPKAKKKDEIIIGPKPVPMDAANKAIKSICKITTKMPNDQIGNGTGFFMKVSDSMKCLITNYHVVDPKLINNIIEIEVWNHTNFKLDLNNYKITYFEKPKDIAVIQMKNSDEITQNIQFLSYDKNYTEGYHIYQNVDVFSIQHPCGKSAACASGTISSIDNFEFEHNVTTDKGSSGCPIILLNNNISLIQVIGIHKCGDPFYKINGGTFIGEIFKELNNSEITNETKNYIISELEIGDDDINKEINIISSFEECFKFRILKDEDFKRKFNKDYVNEEEIKNCEIKINDILIPFTYFHKFKNKGKYKIK